MRFFVCWNLWTIEADLGEGFKTPKKSEAASIRVSVMHTRKWSEEERICSEVKRWTLTIWRKIGVRSCESRCYLRSSSKKLKTSIIFDPRTMYSLTSEKGKFQLSKSETEAMLCCHWYAVHEYLDEYIKARPLDFLSWPWPINVLHFMPTSPSNIDKISRSSFLR